MPKQVDWDGDKNAITFKAHARMLPQQVGTCISAMFMCISSVWHSINDAVGMVAQYVLPTPDAHILNPLECDRGSTASMAPLSRR